MKPITDPPRTVFEGKYQRMVVRGTWEYAERTHAGGAAALILAVTPDDRVLLVDQFRVPLQTRVIEFPAGLVGDEHAGESIEASAIRELEEETGWTADHAQLLVTCPTSPGGSTEQISIVLATGLRRIGDGGGVDDEDIVVCAVPRHDVPAWLMQQQAAGKLLDCKLWSGLWLLDHHLDGSLRG